MSVTSIVSARTRDLDRDRDRRAAELDMLVRGLEPVGADDHVVRTVPHHDIERAVVGTRDELARDPDHRTTDRMLRRVIDHDAVERGVGVRRARDHAQCDERLHGRVNVSAVTPAP